MANTKRQQRSQGQAGGQTRAAGSGATSSSNTSASQKSTSTTGAGSSRLAELRKGAQGSPRPQPRRRFAQEPWWKRNLGALITVSVIVVLIGSFIGYNLYQNRAASVGIGSPVPSSVMKDVTGVPASVFDKVGTGSVKSDFLATPLNTPVLTKDSKPEIIYVGAEYCPFCAAERWGTVVALSRFGSFSGLELMRSTPGDVYPNTPTFSFRNATYTSEYIVFNATETQDRNQQALATPDATAMQAFSTYDTAPYTTQTGGIPFVSYANQYVTTGGPYTPTMLAGLDWQQVSSQLSNPNSDVTKAVIGTANYQTAAICKLTNNQPGDVCNTPVIQKIEATLPAAK